MCRFEPAYRRKRETLPFPVNHTISPCGTHDKSVSVTSTPPLGGREKSCPSGKLPASKGYTPTSLPPLGGVGMTARVPPCHPPYDLFGNQKSALEMTGFLKQRNRRLSRISGLGGGLCLIRPLITKSLVEPKRIAGRGSNLVFCPSFCNSTGQHQEGLVAK